MNALSGIAKRPFSAAVGPNTADGALAKGGRVAAGSPRLVHNQVPSSFQHEPLRISSAPKQRSAFSTYLGIRGVDFSSRTRIYSTGPANMSFVKATPPALSGQSVSEVATPALLIDIEVLERNASTLKSLLSRFPAVKCRPHAKAHKCPQLAVLQLDLLGEVSSGGVCAQTVTEAEAMVAGGVKDVLVSNQVVPSHKILRLVELARTATVGVCVDSAKNVSNLSAAASAAGISLRVLVECNVGQNRCGVDTPSEAVRLAKDIQALPGLYFDGIQAYHGAIQHVRHFKERESACTEVARRTKGFVDALAEAGLACNTVTGGGTGTFFFEAGSGLYTEVQPGSWFLGDCDYGRNEGEAPGTAPSWEQSLTIRTTVISRNDSRRMVVCDAGTKAVSLDSGPPAVVGCDSMQYICGGDEHGILHIPEGSGDLQALPQIDQVVTLVPGHCDPTVNLHDWFCLVRAERIEHVWPISGRGPGC